MRPYFFGEPQRRELLQRLGDEMLARPSGIELAEQVGAPASCELTPTEWLEATPLRRRLRQRAASERDQGK